jgi:type I restriction enzyme S subunit
MRMSKQEKKALVPERRFPEFRGKGVWENEFFEKIYSFKTTNSLSRDKLNYKQGTVKNIHYGDIHTKFSALFDIKREVVPYINPSESLGKIKPESFCLEGDMIFADASEDVDDIGKSIEIVSLNNEKLVSGLHTLLARQIKKKLITGFAGYLFKSNWIREQIKKEAQGAKVLGLSAGRLSSISVAYPPGDKEQQKIVDCLTSIDELITAQTQKLDVLKTHKKGLMQQLFPTEGETMPRFRFPEFRDKGEWEFKALIKLTPTNEKYGIVDGPFGSNLKTIHYKKEGVPIITSGYVTEGVFCAEKYDYVTPEKFEREKRSRVNGGDIVMAKIGARCGASAIMPLNHEQGILSGNALKITVDETRFSTMFVWQQLWFLYQIGSLDGLKKVGAQPAISISNLKTFEILLPREIKEQQRIADCLSSIDDLISNQAKKVEALKTHKKGLMQQLFPATDEVDK